MITPVWMLSLPREMRDLLGQAVCDQTSVLVRWQGVASATERSEACPLPPDEVRRMPSVPDRGGPPMPISEGRPGFGAEPRLQRQHTAPQNTIPRRPLDTEGSLLLPRMRCRGGGRRVGSPQDGAPRSTSAVRTFDPHRTEPPPSGVGRPHHLKPDHPHAAPCQQRAGSTTVPGPARTVPSHGPIPSRIGVPN
jgi:hypothetical protein